MAGTLLPRHLLSRPFPTPVGEQVEQTKTTGAIFPVYLGHPNLQAHEYAAMSTHAGR